MRIVDFNTHFHVHIEFNQWFKRNLGEIHKLRDKRFDGDLKVWVIPSHLRSEVNDIAIKCKAAMVQHQDQTPQQVGEIGELPMPTFDIPVSLKAPGAPRPYQKAGIGRGMELKRFINGDDMGLGKTAQSILTIHTAYTQGEKVFPHLVICPATLKENWKREWEMWTNCSVKILNDSIKDTWTQFYQVGMAQVFIVNYESLKKFFVESMPSKKGRFSKSKDIVMKKCIELIKSVTVDESHRVKDSTTLQSKLTLRICHGKEWINLLTGTPVKNKPIELFPQLAIMGQLHHFGGRKGFLDRYCEGGQGASNLRELNYKLNQLCYFRREKKDVLTELPDKQRQRILCEISNREEYEFAKKHFELWLQGIGKTDGEINNAMRAEVLVQMGKLRGISARGKLAEVREFVEEVMESGEKLVLFCNLREIVHTIQKMFPKAVTITGDVTGDARQRNIDAFQRDPNTQLIICNIQAAGVGITLTASSRVGFVELPWTYADAAQCEDRCNRMGQKNAVMCTYFLGKDTIDEKVFDLIMEKKDIHGQITGASDKMEMSTVDKMINLFR